MHVIAKVSLDDVVQTRLTENGYRWYRKVFTSLPVGIEAQTQHLHPLPNAHFSGGVCSMTVREMFEYFGSGMYANDTDTDTNSTVFFKDRTVSFCPKNAAPIPFHTKSWVQVQLAPDYLGYYSAYVLNFIFHAESLKIDLPQIELPDRDHVLTLQLRDAMEIFGEKVSEKGSPVFVGSTIYLLAA